MLVLLVGGIYVVHLWDEVRRHGVHNKFHKGWFRHQKFLKWDKHTHTNTHESNPISLLFQNIKSRLKMEYKSLVIEVWIKTSGLLCHCYRTLRNLPLVNFSHVYNYMMYRLLKTDACFERSTKNSQLAHKHWTEALCWADRWEIFTPACVNFAGLTKQCNSVRIDKTGPGFWGTM
jgi:hypothetical protein